MAAHSDPMDLFNQIDDPIDPMIDPMNLFNQIDAEEQSILVSALINDKD
jgi:hypothetical protein